MQDTKNKFNILHKSYLQIAGILLLILLAAFLLWFNKSNSKQSVGASVIQVYFDGEYRIGDGEWQKIEEGKHIPATQGDVTLRGNFHTLTPSGEYIGQYKGKSAIAFYTDHINLTFIEAGYSYTIDHENPLYGDSACGKDWTSHTFTNGNTDPIEIIIRNLTNSEMKMPWMIC